MRTIRTAAAFSSGLYLRVVGFPGDCSFGIAPSSFPRSGASRISRAIQTPATPTVGETSARRCPSTSRRTHQGHVQAWSLLLNSSWGSFESRWLQVKERPTCMPTTLQPYQTRSLSLYRFGNRTTPSTLRPITRHDPVVIHGTCGRRATVHHCFREQQPWSNHRNGVYVVYLVSEVDVAIRRRFAAHPQRCADRARRPPPAPPGRMRRCIRSSGNPPCTRLRHVEGVGGANRSPIAQGAIRGPRRFANEWRVSITHLLSTVLASAWLAHHRC
ncbi:hypothetical protein I549_4385 [Mycobacterium avium subsp. avium 2285 (R)]|nr:hypothetical protein I549_4385 [Mycobacterium avium subsp. avium 2285 (R)]